MPSPIEQALTQLLPTTSPLPIPLVELATSLLAQSRSKASALKPEEEIGRTYAVCHIACERLGKKLSLELTGKPNPPCPPRVYSKLKTYLGSVLRTPTTPRTPRKKDADIGEGQASQGASAKKDNTTPKSQLATRTPPSRKAAASTAGAARKRVAPSDDLSGRIISKLCDLFDARPAEPHIVSAQAAVLEDIRRQQINDSAEPSAKRRRTGKQSETPAMPTVPAVPEEKMPALLMALCVIVVDKGRYESKLASKDYEQRKKQAIKLVTQLCWDTDELVSKVDEEIMKANFEEYMQQAGDHWIDMEWYKQLPIDYLAAAGGPTADLGDEDGDGEGTRSATAKKRPSKTPLRRKEKHAKRPSATADDEDDLGPAGLLPGLGTMFQPAVDWLSEERRAEYALWEQQIWRDIAKAEKASA